MGLEIVAVALGAIMGDYAQAVAERSLMRPGSKNNEVNPLYGQPLPWPGAVNLNIPLNIPEGVHIEDVSGASEYQLGQAIGERKVPSELIEKRRIVSA